MGYNWCLPNININKATGALSAETLLDHLEIQTNSQNVVCFAEHSVFTNEEMNYNSRQMLSSFTDKHVGKLVSTLHRKMLSCCSLSILTINKHMFHSEIGQERYLRWLDEGEKCIYSSHTAYSWFTRRCRICPHFVVHFNHSCQMFNIPGGHDIQVSTAMSK